MERLRENFIVSKDNATLLNQGLKQVQTEQQKYLFIIKIAKLENRRKKQDIYYELHHILPIGKKCYTNGIINKYFFLGQQEENFYLGKTMRRTK